MSVVQAALRVGWEEGRDGDEALVAAGRRATRSSGTRRGYRSGA
jgi:hypothetical protein